jgi:hypothetical protein
LRQGGDFDFRFEETLESHPSPRRAKGWGNLQERSAEIPSEVEGSLSGGKPEKEAVVRYAHAHSDFPFAICICRWRSGIQV